MDIQGLYVPACVFVLDVCGAHVVCSVHPLQGGAWQMKLLGVNWCRNCRCSKVWGHNTTPLFLSPPAWTLRRYGAACVFVCEKELRDKAAGKDTWFAAWIPPHTPFSLMPHASGALIHTVCLCFRSLAFHINGLFWSLCTFSLCVIVLHVLWYISRENMGKLMWAHMNISYGKKLQFSPIYFHRGNLPL